MPDYQESLDLTFEVQSKQKDAYLKHGGVKLRPWSTHLYFSDPKHLAFSLSRYKFVSKIFKNYQTVLEIGCGDAFGSMIISSAKKYVGIDFDDFIIRDNTKRYKMFKNEASFYGHDILKSPFS